MAVIARKFDTGKTQEYKMAATTTITENTFVAFTSGYVRPAISTDAELRVVALQTKTSTVLNEPILCLNLDETIELEIDTAGDTSQALVGTKVDLTSAGVCNQAATSTKVLRVTGLVGAASNRKIKARVVGKDS